MQSRRFDLAIIGGGINGAAIARDAAGRGLSVFLAEAQDYAQGTSSRSSKLIHGGLRYLEQGEIHLVRESLSERATLLRIAPHLVRPLHFLLPVHRLYGRPAWLLRLGLVFYDLFAGRQKLNSSGRLTSNERMRLTGLKQNMLSDVLYYSDCAGDDTRLVIETLLDARAHGADIGNYRRVLSVRKNHSGFTLKLHTAAGEQEIEAQCVVNAAGPWVNEVVENVFGATPQRKLRLVRGSHLVVAMPKPGFDHAFLLQNPDKRVVFVIPWLEGQRLLIGTTDVNHTHSPDEVTCTAAERDYLLSSYNRYFTPALEHSDILESFAGLRPLVGGANKAAQKLSRDYLIMGQAFRGAALMTVYGGKLTTHRALAEKVLRRLARLLPHTQAANWGPSWTAHASLPGALPRDKADDNSLAALSPAIRARYQHLYGTRQSLIAGILSKEPQTAREIAQDVIEAELIFARDHEDARGPEDFLYRRTHLGFVMSLAEQEKIARWFSRSVKQNEG